LTIAIHALVHLPGRLAAAREELIDAIDAGVVPAKRKLGAAIVVKTNIAGFPAIFVAVDNHGRGRRSAIGPPGPAAIKPWPKKIAEQIAAVRDRVAFPGKLFTVESVAAAFKGAKKKDIEGFLDGFAALGVLTAFEGADGKRWRAAGRST
jgi:hypothetical protein